METKKFSDFAKSDESHLEGEKLKVGDILGKEILLKNFAVSKSKHYAGDYATVQFELAGKLQVSFISSKVIIEQLQKYGAEMPFLTTIIKIGKYYSLS